jgi:predicted GNAT family N-acyltransferase
MTEPAFAVRIADWHRDAGALRSVRRVVFIEEQKVPEHLEWDGLDATAVHAIAEHAGTPIGTARLLADGQVGRMAVLPEWRGRGVGTALLRLIAAQESAPGMPDLWLNAQLHAVPFYRKLGFNAEGESFMEAGIPHRRMVRHPQR